MVHTVLSHSLLRMSHVWPYPKFAQYLAHRYLSHMDVDVDVGTDSTGSCHSTAANASGCSALHRKMKKNPRPSMSLHILSALIYYYYFYYDFYYYFYYYYYLLLLASLGWDHYY